MPPFSLEVNRFSAEGESISVSKFIVQSYKVYVLLTIMAITNLNYVYKCILCYIFNG